MGMILKPMIDQTGGQRLEPFVRIDALRSKRMFGGMRIIVVVYHDFATFAAGNIPAFFQTEFDIPARTQLFSERFRTDQALSANVSDYTMAYDFLREIDGSNQSITFMTQAIGDYNVALMKDGAPVFDDDGNQVFQVVSGPKDVLDIRINALKGLDFTGALPTFTEAEIARGALDGMPYGAPVFCEDTGTVWTRRDGTYQDTALSVLAYRQANQ